MQTFYSTLSKKLCISLSSSFFTMFSTVAQHLPFHIISTIIEYVCEPDDIKDDNTGNFDTKLCNVGHICSSWRVAALSLFFKSGNFEFWKVDDENANSRLSFGIDNNNNYCLKKVNEYLKYTLSIYFRVPFKMIADGSIFQEIRNKRLDTLCFPRVKHLRTSIRVLFDEELPINMVNCIHFIEFVKAIVKYKELNFVLLGSMQSTDERFFNLIQLMYSQFCRNSINMSMSTLSWNASLIGVLLLTVTPLISLTCRWAISYETIAAVIHKNSQCLQTLFINYNTFAGFEQLFVYKNNCMVYPRMTELSLVRTQPFNEDLPMLQFQNDYAPFPYLVNLEILFEYPFSDDVVFRNNSNSLKILQLNLKSVDLLNRICKGSSNPPILNRLLLYSNETELRIDEFKHFSVYVMTSLRRLEIYNQCHYNALLASLPNRRLLSRLAILEINCKENTLDDIINLLYTFPSIRTLHCPITKICSKHTTKVSDVIDKVRVSNGKLNSNFSTLCILNLSSNLSPIYASSIILLSKGYENFRHILFQYNTDLAPLLTMNALSDSTKLVDLKKRLFPIPEFSIHQVNKRVHKRFIRIERE
ncbi:hypothetical protein BX667DRAFT_186791 [Coemansia mojavensis]|nr:hypothetical protein BX667DRAFT_186791 [Coemansia mojavensis]